MVTARMVAEAICKVCRRAGQAWDAERHQTVAQRVENLLRDGPYGPYIADGDPHEWGGPGTLATIYMEAKGDDGDCMIPLEYYGDGMLVSIEASALLPGNAYIEFVNAAVAVVYSE